MSSTEKWIETRCLSSLTKVFPDEEILEQPFQRASAMHNETYSFQVAYRIHNANRAMKKVHIQIHSALQSEFSVRSVGLVPSELPCYPDHDEFILRSTPGLYPDPLYPVAPLEGVTAFPDQWRSIWITVRLNGNEQAGDYPIKIAFETESGDVLGEETFELEIIPISLPEQKLIHTEWLHTDCLSIHYNVEVFSEAHWHKIGQFVETAVQNGINMILTPLFTPPLDTKIGGERLTVQLVDVKKEASTYIFGFERLERWIRLCREKGVKYFEFSHLFTQWGAKHAPKIMTMENGNYKQIFGWDTDASEGEYKQFLAQFLPELIRFIKENGLENNCYFHISDEPLLADMLWYKSASEAVKPYLNGLPVIDAMTNYEFYKQGLVGIPIPAVDHIHDFLNHQVPNLWTYYGCTQNKHVSNRFFNMPSARNRIIGMQLYKYNISGFLHWGFNFWLSQYSIKPIDPFKNTDANYAFPSGDAFMVYPGESGPVESIRLQVFHEALQDLRALQLLDRQRTGNAAYCGRLG